jgi:hypothetical protein
MEQVAIIYKPGFADANRQGKNSIVINPRTAH